MVNNDERPKSKLKKKSSMFFTLKTIQYASATLYQRTLSSPYDALNPNICPVFNDMVIFIGRSGELNSFLPLYYQLRNGKYVSPKENIIFNI